MQIRFAVPVSEFDPAEFSDAHEVLERTADVVRVAEPISRVYREDGQVWVYFGGEDTMCLSLDELPDEWEVVP